MIKHTTIFLSIVFLFFAVHVEAQTGSSAQTFEPFRSVATVAAPPSIAVPTVVELPLSITPDRNNALVREMETDTLVGSIFGVRSTYVTEQQNITHNGSGSGYLLQDNNSNTEVSFDVRPELDVRRQMSVAELFITTPRPITSSALQFQLANHVALPELIGISARDASTGQNRVLRALDDVSSTRIAFPEMTSSKWTVEFHYSQPLRLSEFGLLERGAERLTSRSVRFLARPGMNYQVYLDPDRHTTVRTTEVGNLASSDGVVALPTASVVPNVLFKESDVDDDGVPDIRDNCVSRVNSDQLDINANGRGDVCDDFDRDGIINSLDNCPEHTNSRQRDEDGDGIGDECDGEESRFTEQYPWAPWLGIALAAGVLIVLFTLTAISMRREKSNEAVESNPELRGDGMQ